MNAVKSGWKTTEFWMTLVVVVVAYLLSTDLGSAETYPVLAKVLGLAAAVLAALGYQVSRTAVKKTNGKAEPITYAAMAVQEESKSGKK